VVKFISSDSRIVFICISVLEFFVIRKFLQFRFI